MTLTTLAAYLHHRSSTHLTSSADLDERRRDVDEANRRWLADLATYLKPTE